MTGPRTFRERLVACTPALAALAVLVALAPAGAAKSATAPAPARPAAVVLVTVDTLRADRVSFDGYHLPTTPFLDRLAASGVVFERAYAASSWTPPTMASIFTGVAPATHGVVSGEITERRVLQQPILPASLTTLAELAQHAGFRTIGVASNLHLAADLGFAQGFDRYFDPPGFLPATRVNAEARRLLTEEYGPEGPRGWRSRPLFLWLHYFDPHDPYFPEDDWMASHAPGVDPRAPDSPARSVMRELHRRFPRPDAALAERIRPFYDSEIHRTDRAIETLWSELGASDDVLFIFTADHGEEIADHGHLGHGTHLHEEVVRVPLMLYWPRGLPAGRRISEPVSLLDLWPTLSELFGLEPPAGLPGHSLVPRWAGKPAASAPAAPIFLSLDPPKPHLWAVIDGDSKLIVDPSSREADELYDLATDPGERTNLAAARPAIVEKLRDELRRWDRSQPRAPDRGVRETADERLRGELEALGYLDPAPTPSSQAAPPAQLSQPAQPAQPAPAPPAAPPPPPPPRRP